VDAPARDVDADRRGRRRERAVGRAGSLGLHRHPRVTHLAGEPRARAVDEVVEAKLLVALVERAGAKERLELWHVTAGAREDGGVGQCVLRAVDEERQRAGERADERGRCEFDARAEAEPVEPRRELGRVAHEHVARHAGRVAVGDAHDRGVEARRGCRRRRWRHVLDDVVEHRLHAQVSHGVRRLQRPRFKRGCDFFTCGDLNVGLVVDVRRDVLVVAERRAGDIDAVPDAAVIFVTPPHKK